jgi:hypothetical protein
MKLLSIKGKKFIEKMSDSNCLENKSAACSQSHGPFVRAVLNQGTTISTKVEDIQDLLAHGEGRNCLQVFSVALK